MKIFLTGGRGFIGRNIVESFGEEHEIDAPYRTELNLTDTGAVASWFTKRSYDLVIHCATKPAHRNATDPTGVYAANMAMFQNIAGQRKKFGRLIYVGSGSEFDPAHYMPKMKEEYLGTHVPSDESSRSKYEIARIVEDTPGMLNLRLFGVFGRYEDYSIRFISNAICRAIFGLPIRINENKLFDYVYIDDFLVILRHFISGVWKHNSYNVTPDGPAEIRRLAEIVVAASGKDLPIIVGNKGLGVEYSGDNSRIRADLGPLFKLRPPEETIPLLYGWYTENIGMIDRSILTSDKGQGPSKQ